MMARLRRIRLLALVLLIGSPGLGGGLAQALHSCTAEMPWLAGADARSGHGQHGHGADAAEAEAAAQCHCIGSCAAGAPILSPTPAPVVRAAAGAARHASLPRTAAIAAAPPSDRLPPATAPPLVV